MRKLKEIDNAELEQKCQVFKKQAVSLCEKRRAKGDLAEAENYVKKMNPEAYVRTRNYLDGDVTRLSPYIRFGIVNTKQLVNLFKDKPNSEKLIQELMWHEYWHHVYEQFPQYIWSSVESYKTGFTNDDYSDQLPHDIQDAKTPNTAINQLIEQLYTTGYVHNHGRLYLASYVVHWRRIQWQVGARWFLRHLLDGDQASNNFSWQWVASTFAKKPYYYNLENLDKYAGNCLDTTKENNPDLDHTYEELHSRLFPHLASKNTPEYNEAGPKVNMVSPIVPFKQLDELSEKTRQDKICILHDQCLNFAVASHFQQSIFIWDEDHFDSISLNVNQKIFICEALLDLKNRLHQAGKSLIVWEGSLKNLFNHNQDVSFVMPFTSHKTLRDSVKDYDCEIMDWKRIITKSKPIDFKRFFRFWNRAQKVLKKQC